MVLFDSCNQSHLVVKGFGGCIGKNSHHIMCLPILTHLPNTTLRCAWISRWKVWKVGKMESRGRRKNDFLPKLCLRVRLEM